MRQNLLRFQYNFRPCNHFMQQFSASLCVNKWLISILFRRQQLLSFGFLVQYMRIPWTVIRPTPPRESRNHKMKIWLHNDRFGVHVQINKFINCTNILYGVNLHKMFVMWLHTVGFGMHKGAYYPTIHARQCSSKHKNQYTHTRVRNVMKVPRQSKSGVQTECVYFYASNRKLKWNYMPTNLFSIR